MNAPQTIIGIIAWLIGGLALFLFGIDMMGRSLRKAAGSALRTGLERLTRTRVHGLVTGVAVTALLQSSSATTVMVVGFISAGLLSFSQSIGLIIGANLGSPITPFIATLDLEKIALPALAVGFVLNFASRKRAVQKFGLACMGFGMLFLGLILMQSAIAEHKDVIKGWLTAIGSNGLQGRFIGFAVAIAVTSIIQSSGATIVVIAKLAEQGAIPDLGMMIPMILGAHIGTCVTALLAAMRASRSAKRAAVTHLVFNLVGVGITFACFPLYMSAMPRLASSPEMQVVLSHFAIKVMNSVVLLPFTPQLAWIATRLVPGRDLVSTAPEFLDTREDIAPEQALDSALKEIRRVCASGLEILHDAVEALLENNEPLQELVIRREDAIDDLQKTVVDYVCKISLLDLPPDLCARPPMLLHILKDAERIGDHAENIVETSSIYTGKHGRFSDGAQAELSSLAAELAALGERTLDMMDDPTDSKARSIVTQRTTFEQHLQTVMTAHNQRLAQGSCSVMSGIVYTEVLTNLQSVAHHLRDIARTLATNPEI